MRTIQKYISKNPNSSKSPISWIGWVIKLGITCGAVGYVIWKLKGEGDALWETFSSFHLFSWVALSVAFILIPINIGIEAEKWRLMLRDYYPNLSYKRAVQAILAGFSTGIFTPNRIGEYAGRILYLKPGKRVEAVTLTFIERICQMVITLWVGAISLCYLMIDYKSKIIATSHLAEHWLWIGIGVISLISILTLVFVLRPYWFFRLLSPIISQYPILLKTQQAVEKLESRLLIRVLSLGLLRYLTFSTQYVVLMFALGYSSSPMQAYIMVWMIFLIKSAIPSVALSELGIRESTAIAVMGMFGIGVATAFSSSLLLYIYNIIIPSLLGLVFVYRIKW